MEQQTDKNEDIINDNPVQKDELEQSDIAEQTGGSSENPEYKPSENKAIHFPGFIKRFGVWPINIGLFFFYSNVVSLFVLIIGLTIMSSTGVKDEAIIVQKLGGLSVISTVITLGLTLIYSRRFYFSKY